MLINWKCVNKRLVLKLVARSSIVTAMIYNHCNRIEYDSMGGANGGRQE